MTAPTAASSIPFAREPLPAYREYPITEMIERARQFHADIARRRAVRDSARPRSRRSASSTAARRCRSGSRRSNPWAPMPTSRSSSQHGAGNLKTTISGTHNAFKFAKYASEYLGAFSYRFDQRFNLQALLRNLLGRAVTATPTRERRIRAMAGMAKVHD